MRVSSLILVVSVGFVIGLAACSDCDDEDMSRVLPGTAGHAGTAPKDTYRDETAGKNDGGGVGQPWVYNPLPQEPDPVRPEVGGSGGETAGGGGSGAEPGGGGSGGQPAGGGGAGGSVVDPCTAITLGKLSGLPGQYSAPIAPGVVGPAPDYLDILLNTLTDGTFDLAGAANTDATTCTQCLVARVDIGSASPKRFFQAAGSIVIRTSATDLASGLFDATLTGVRLTERETDGSATAGGACLTISSANVAIAPVTGWTCMPGMFEDGFVCDCLCGTWDPDCNESALASDPENCAPGEECKLVTPGNTSMCE